MEPMPKQNLNYCSTTVIEQELIHSTVGTAADSQACASNPSFFSIVPKAERIIQPFFASFKVDPKYPFSAFVIQSRQLLKKERITNKYWKGKKEGKASFT